MKAFRVCFYTVMALCLLGGMINGIRAYYLVFFFQLALVCISLALNLWTILSFSYVQQIDEKRAVKGGFCQLHVGIYNDKPFPFTMMRVHVGMVSDAQEQVLLVNLMPLASVHYDLPVLLPYRGQYQIGMTVLEITDIFGLLPMKFDMRRLSYYRQRPLLIYPNLVHLNSVRPVAGDEKTFSGAQLTAAPEGDSFAQVRDYHMGDSGKRIHWKLFAARRALYTRQYDIPAQTHTLILIANTRREGEEGLRYADVCCECAAALSFYCLSRAYPVRIAEGNERRKPVSALTMAGFAPLYDYLAKLPFDAQARDFAAVADRHVRLGHDVRSLYLLTDTLDSQLFTVVQTALSRLIDVTCIYAQPETQSGPAPQGARTLTLRYGDDIGKALEKIV